MKITTYILILLTTLLNTGCSPRNQLYQADPFYVFGTLVEISIWGLPESEARQAVNTIAQDFQVMHQTWHPWHPSPLTELNQAIATKQLWPVKDSSLLSLIEQAKFFSKLSEGLFNPAIGQLIELWGFHNDELPVGPPPAATKIAQLVALAPSMEDISIVGNQVSSHNPAVQLDFGAIAKGYAVDLAIHKLRQLGVQNAIVNAGGNLKAMGQKGDQPWRIGIRHPSGHGVLAAVTVSGEESVMTSGNYERYREYQGERYSHIIDPRNGKPVVGITSVTVLTCSGSLGDAASTALTVAGLPDWQRLAKQMMVKYVMLVDEAGTVYLTKDMEKRVQFLSPKEVHTVVSDTN